MPSSSDPADRPITGKPTPKGPAPLFKAPVDPTKTVTAIAKPSKFVGQRTRALASPEGSPGFESHSSVASIPRYQGVGVSAKTPGGGLEKKLHPPANGGLKNSASANSREPIATGISPNSSATASPPAAAASATNRNQLLADRRAMLLEILEKKKAGTLPPSKAKETPGPSGAKLKPATKVAGSPRFTGEPPGGSRLVHDVPTDLYGSVKVHESTKAGNPPQYHVHLENRKHWERARDTAVAMGGRYDRSGGIQFDTPRSAKEFADSLAVNPSRRRVREDELGNAVVEDLDHADEFDLGGEPSTPASSPTKPTSTRKGISRSKDRASAAQSIAEPPSSEGSSPPKPRSRKPKPADAAVVPEPSASSAATNAATTSAQSPSDSGSAPPVKAPAKSRRSAKIAAAPPTSSTTSPTATSPKPSPRSRKPKASQIVGDAKEVQPSGSSAKAATKKRSTSSNAQSATEPEGSPDQSSRSSIQKSPPTAPSPAASASPPASSGSGPAPTPTKAAPATPAMARASGTSRGTGASSAADSVQYAGTARAATTSASTAPASASTEGRARPVSRADRSLAIKHFNNTTHWHVAGKKLSAQSAGLANSIHWALNLRRHSTGVEEVAKAGPYSIEADLGDGKVRGIYLKLKDGRYKVPLDRPAEGSSVTGDAILAAIKRTMKHLATEDKS